MTFGSPPLLGPPSIRIRILRTIVAPLPDVSVDVEETKWIAWVASAANRSCPFKIRSLVQFLPVRSLLIRIVAIAVGPATIERIAKVILGQRSTATCKLPEPWFDKAQRVYSTTAMLPRQCLAISGQDWESQPAMAASRDLDKWSVSIEVTPSESSGDPDRLISSNVIP